MRSRINYLAEGRKPNFGRGVAAAREKTIIKQTRACRVSLGAAQLLNMCQHVSLGAAQLLNMRQHVS